MLKKTMNLAAVLFWAWIIFSFVEVLCKNVRPDPLYSAWNLFVLLF